MATARRYCIAEATKARWTGDLVLPSVIHVEEDGTAVAAYDHTPLVRFPTLHDLLRRFRLELRDLVECPPDSATRPRENPTELTVRTVGTR